MKRTEIARLIVELLDERDPGKTICPSEVARAIDPADFRPWMPEVRAAAATLVRRGRIDVVQHGQVVDLESARGPIRLRSKP